MDPNQNQPMGDQPQGGNVPAEPTGTPTPMGQVPEPVVPAGEPGVDQGMGQEPQVPGVPAEPEPMVPTEPVTETPSTEVPVEQPTEAEEEPGGGMPPAPAA